MELITDNHFVPGADEQPRTFPLKVTSSGLDVDVKVCKECSCTQGRVAAVCKQPVPSDIVEQ